MESYWPFLEYVPQVQQDLALLEQFGFVPGLKDWLTMRQVHALEHATVWLLGQRLSGVDGIDAESLSGLSLAEGFFLYGNVHRTVLSWAVQEAYRRLCSGEWNLAVHPRCGTNVSVNFGLMASLGIGISAVLPPVPLAPLVGFGLASAIADQLTPELGSLVQRHVTTAIPYNLKVLNIRPIADGLDRKGYFVSTCWVD